MAGEAIVVERFMPACKLTRIEHDVRECNGKRSKDKH